MSQPTFTLGNALGAAPEPKPAGQGDLIKDTTFQTFVPDVIEASQSVPVLVDFWAPWCGPCKQLTPVLEKVVKAAGGKVKLVKMNIDEHPQVAGQLGIQSIPAVIAFVDGRPLDGFMGAQSEAQVMQFIEKLVGPVGPSDIDQMLAAGAESLAEKDFGTAAECFVAVLEEDQGNLVAIGGLARAQIGQGALDVAEATLAMTPKGKETDMSIVGARAELELARTAEKLGDVADLALRVDSDPADHQARFELALALNARGDTKGAIDNLIEIVRRDRTWDEDAARKQLVQFFDAWGPKDENTLYGRRRLSAVLFS
ncbi:Thioredoxin-M [Hartmannibacter diazotrophicus]|uniref:Thioredoxin n=1 Tax=Hartmannibacter diazotrophicus TaxID=1482074 RepID=A0A2C9DAC9_9HYPH|nr:thioredoxin [Hartmannibacter diazotrophicus]SON57247.1 Thioredoxin-M [Hartmannibacter diazotrophicus]